MVRLGFFLNILFAWLLLLMLSYLTVNVVAGLVLQNGYLLRFIEAVSKTLSVAILIALWLYIWKKLSKLYFEKLLKDRIPSSDR